LAAAVCTVALLGLASSAAGGIRDDTAWLQARLDAGGTLFLPRLPDGRCYATRGLWVSRDDMTVSSDGACMVALGPGEGRIKRGDGTFVKANAVFFVDHSDVRKPLPVRIAISALHITVPAATRMYGISVLGHEVTLSGLTIDGSPLTDVRIGSGTKGFGGMSGRIAVTDSNLSGGLRDVISASGPVGLRVEGNTLAGARGKAASGLHIRAADRGQPTLGLHVAGNRIVANAGPGIFLDLAPANGLPVLASGIEIARNELIGNARKAPKERRAGIVLAGGQNDGGGQIVVHENLFRGNHGPEILRRKVRTASTAGPRSFPPPSTTAVRDDTAWLQARLDRAGGTIFLPKLPNGECYASRGLWVSRDGTTITSDGACIVSLGLGPVRLHSIDGDPIAASAVFFVNRSTPSKPAPVRVTISNLRIIVSEGQSMYGVAIFGHQITLSQLDIGGAPKDDVTISGRGNGNSYAGSVSILDSTLSGATRNAISATAVIGLRIERNTIVGVRDSPPGQPAAGIDVEPDDRGQPALDVRIVANTIQDNAGPGILLELEPNDGPAVVATAIEITGNTILRNSAKRTPPKRGGIVLAGGQDGGQGTLVLKDNVIRGNGGHGILKSRLRLLVDSDGNDVSGNETA
jgi:parallel beta helix pectate lyase-like protein